MKFALAVYGAPCSSQAPQTALHFARAVLQQGHEIVRLFFLSGWCAHRHHSRAAPSG